MGIYEQGFIDKCAEYGINPVELVKYAKVNASFSPKLLGTGKALASPRLGGSWSGLGPQSGELFSKKKAVLAAIISALGLTGAGAATYQIGKGIDRKATPLPHLAGSKGSGLASLIGPAAVLGVPALAAGGVAGAAIAGSRAKSKDKDKKKEGK